MDRVPQRVLNWLHSILLGGYRDVNRTYSDAGVALGRFPTIRPSTDTYTYDDGRTALLLHLSGTIPSNFRGVTYSFPVSVWIPQEYPAWPPIAFVTASQGMAVRPGQHVSVEGKIYHPYLGGWQPDRSSISDLLQILTEIFSREPPLVARQGGPPATPGPGLHSRSNSLRQPAPTASPGQPQPPALPPKGDEAQQQQQQRQQSPGALRNPPPPPPGNQGPPPRPPKPGDHVPNPHTALGQQRPQSITSPPPQHPPRQGSISLGPAPGSGHQAQSWQQQQQGQQRSNQQQQQQQYRPMPPVPQGLGLHQGQQHPPAPGQIPQYHQQQQPTPAAQNWQQQQQQQLPQQYQQYQPQQQYQQQSLPLQQQQQQQQQPRKAPEAPDLLTSPFDVPLPDSSKLPVPPVPPNPEKDMLLAAISSALSQQLQQTLASNAEALPALQAQHAALQQAYVGLQQEFAHLRALEAQVRANEQTLHASLAEADACIADARRAPAPDVDDTLIAPTVLAGQMYSLAADERAGQAARLVLTRALDRGRLSVHQWSRNSRSLARDEWLKKWLLRSAARGMGLQGTDASMGFGGEKEVADDGGGGGAASGGGGGGIGVGNGGDGSSFYR